ncbi:hypothetical protein BC834DRAFT_567240 [Gloeopeniophorella convolvens]|nr:hypothetical protein BC834DRAFT_567240 [Gloeopeniophorella convolvens]
MNKLRKPRPDASYPSRPPSMNTAAASAAAFSTSKAAMPPQAVSKTLYYAQESLVAVAKRPDSGIVDGAATAPVPDTFDARYWAARALAAETRLDERRRHTQELRGEDAKHANEFTELRRVHEAQQAKMERLVMCCIAALSATLLYLVASRNHAVLQPHKGPTHHYTIPILSPFTSVVEHETSAWGARIVIPALMVAAALAYAVFRHWAGRWHSR